MSKHKYPQRRVLVNPDRDQATDFYAETDRQAPLAERQRIAGLVEYPAGVLQVWLSVNGLDVQPVAAASTEQEAEALCSALKSFLRTSESYDDEQTAAFTAQLAVSGDVKPQPLSDDIVRQIGRAIRHEIAMREEI